MARIALGGLLGLAIAFVCASQLQNVAAAGLPTKLYIVRFHQSVASSAPAEVQAVFKELYHRHESDVHADWHAVPEAQFERVFSGAAVRMSEAAADWLRQHPAVADIELDQNFHIIEPLDRLPEPVDMLSMSKGHVQRNLGDVNPQQSRRRALQTSSVRTQSGESIQRFGLWSLDRIDQADAPPYSSSYSYATDGAGVDVYVVDSGVRQTHVDFGGRALAGFDGINDGLPQASDCNGHGTHVAGTVGGQISGVAKNATIIAVRVFGCTGGGSTAVILNALEWVSRTAAARAGQGRRAVVNMSLGGGRSTAFDAATNKLVREGIIVIVAAGNENQDAANASPAAAELAIAVGATDIQDVKATFSNFGPTVDIQAPGVDIFSAWHTSDTAAQTIDGTSMASPAVAGMAARYLQQRPNATPQEVRLALLCSAQRNTLTQIPADGTPNMMLFSTPLGLAVPNADGTCGSPPSDSPGTPPAPPADPVQCPSDCSGRGTCRSDGTCLCNCGFLGADCRIQVPISEGTGLSGAVTGRTSAPDSSAVFGQQAPERFVALTVPSGVTQLTVGTCDPSTNYDTLIWLLSACPSQDLTNADVVGVNDDGPMVSCSPPSAPLPPYTVANFPPPSQLVVNNPPPGRYYVLIEGYQDYAGDYVLRWNMQAPPGTAVPSASPSPGALPSATPVTKPTSGVEEESDDAFQVGGPNAHSSKLSVHALFIVAAAAAAASLLRV